MPKKKKDTTIEATMTEDRIYQIYVGLMSNEIFKDVKLVAEDAGEGKTLIVLYRDGKRTDAKAIVDGKPKRPKLVSNK